MSSSKFIGGTLLIVGTSIGGGMLALPLATAELGFAYTLFYLTLCWFVMTAGALLILEVNLHLKPGSNIISMAGYTLGTPGKIIAWFTYLFLLYALISAYIAGGSDIFNNILHSLSLPLSHKKTALLFTCAFGFIVYQGIHAVDYVNRFFMLGKLLVYYVLIVSIFPYIKLSNLIDGQFSLLPPNLMILATSFGFAAIVPSLRDYFQDDINLLRKVIWFGSLIPLTAYILWEATIMGIIPSMGEFGLISIKNSSFAASGLMTSIATLANNTWMNVFFALFSSICMVTAFLTVSIGLFDFLSDGLNLKKTGIQGKYLITATFLPPFLFVLFFPSIYLEALNYAGVCCVILQFILPIIMAIRTRYDLQSTPHKHEVPGGLFLLSLLLIIGIMLLSTALRS